MITKRIKLFIDSINISISAFEKSIGMSNASFRKLYNNNGAIGSDKLERILTTYPQINPSWLLTGEGSMLRDQVSQTSHGDNSPNINGSGNHLGQASSLMDKAIDEISEMRKLIQEQVRNNQEQVRNNQEQFERFMSVIERLTEKK